MAGKVTEHADTRFDDIDRANDQMESDLAKQYGVLQSDGTYKGGMIGNAEQVYGDAINKTIAWEEEQKKIQNQQTDFAIQKIQQQKDQATKDFNKEKTGAYVDWQKESNKYGANAEQMAAMGMGGTGYAESSQVKMYVTYQNRIATAREIFSRAVLEYDNQMAQARLQNSAALAEIAYNSFQKQTELAIAGAQYKDSLISDLVDKKMEIAKFTQSAYSDLYDQIVSERAQDLNERKFEYEKELAERELALKEEQIRATLDAKGYTANGTKKASERAAANAAKNKTVQVDTIKAAPKKETTNTVTSYQYINELIKSGASNDRVANEISLALRNGAITQAEANKLRSIFTPAGLRY